MSEQGFDLQLFADEGMAVDSPVSTAETNTPANSGTEPTTTQETPVQAETNTTFGVGDYKLEVDANTGERRLVRSVAQPIEETTTTVEGNKLTSEAPVVPPIQEAPYTAEEMMSAMSAGNVDTNRIPEQFKGFYNNLSQQQAMVQQQLMAIQQQRFEAEQAQQAQAQQTQRSQAMMQISNQAREVAMQNLGVSKDDLIDALYSDSDNDLRQRFEQEYANVNAQMQQQYIQNEIQNEHQQIENRLAIQEIGKFSAENLQREPHYKEIGLLMDTLWKTLPYEQASQIESVRQRIHSGQLTRGDLATLQNYYDFAKKTFYAQQTGVTETPKPTGRKPVPNVESSGAVYSAPKQFNFSDMRNMTAGDRSTFVQDFIKNNVLKR